jgi:DNA-binding IclR family transcriptional regulator
LGTADENGHLAVLNGREVLNLVEQRAAGRPPLVTDVDVHLPSHLTASERAVPAEQATLAAREVSRRLGAR